MKNKPDGRMHFTIKVDEDGSLVIPTFAIRGLGYRPGHRADIAIPVDPCMCQCGDNELNIFRGCVEQEEDCYHTGDGALNIPDSMLGEAGIFEGSDATVVVADGALLIVVTTDELSDLPAELCDLLAELDVAPVSVRSISEEDTF